MGLLPRRWRLAVAGLVLAAAPGLAAVPAAAGAVPQGAAAANPAPPDSVIVNPPLPPLVVGGRPTEVRQGVLAGAAYIIEVPPGWNGDLVLWAHGYRGDSPVLTVDPPGFGLRQRLAEDGYAWAASSYDRNGYDVASGVRTTYELARFFGRDVAAPGRTYLAGVSMGGHVIGRSIEEYPGAYDGALPMCGVLGDVELFDFLLDYNLVAQELAGVPAYPIPPDYLARAVPPIQAALGLAGLVPGGPDTTNALGRQLRAVTVERSGGPRPGDTASFAVWKDFLFGIATPDDGGALADNPGRLAQNLDAVYVPDEPVDLDATVRRVAPADLAARVRPTLTAVPRIQGRPRVPVLSLHGLGDLFVPFSMEQVYAEEVERRGRSQLLVQRAVRTAGHCEFSPTEVAAAFDDLVGWVEAREDDRRAPPPAGDPVTDRAAVAAATFGCRFTDPSAYGTGTRALFGPCPAPSGEFR